MVTRWQRSALRLLCLISFLGFLGFRCAASELKPDVLVVLTDQWSPRYLSWENPQVRTPHLDSLASEGMIFDACYTTSPVCMPARVSLLTGLYPHNGGHGLWGNATSYVAPVEAATMFRDIQAAGYTTAQIGKLHWTAGPAWKEQFATEQEYYRALGLDFVVEVSGPPDSAKARDPYALFLEQKGLLQKVAADLHGRYMNWEFEPRASLVSVEDYHDSFVTSAAVEFLQAQPKEKPVCLVVSLHSPHPPLDPPGAFASMFDPATLTLPPNVPEKFARDGNIIDRDAGRRILAAYLGKIGLADQCLGRLIAALKARGTWDRALVLFTADHGEMMGAHGAFTKGRFYEESVRVPLVIRWPGHVQVGRTPALAQMFDIYPTIVEAIGGQPSPGRFAKSLLPVALGRQPQVRTVAISEIGSGAPLKTMARGERYKWWVEERGEYLFDLQTDPWEMTNLVNAPEHQATLEKMRGEMLTAFRTDQVNAAEGYQPKVTRMRAAEKAAEGKQ